MLQLSCNLGCGGGFTCTLKTAHHNGGNGLSRLHLYFGCLRAHERDHFLMNDLDHHLSRIKAVHHICAYGPLFHCLYKLLYNLKIYVCFQKCKLYFPKGCLYILLSQSSLASQIFKHILKFVRQALKCHVLKLL